MNKLVCIAGMPRHVLSVPK